MYVDHITCIYWSRLVSWSSLCRSSCLVRLITYLCVSVPVCQAKSDHHHRHFHLTLLTDVTSSWSSHHVGQCTMRLHCVHGYDWVSCITESYITVIHHIIIYGTIIWYALSRNAHSTVQYSRVCRSVRVQSTSRYGTI